MNIDIDISKVVLKGERLILRSFTEDDLEDFYAYAKTPGLGEAAGWFHHETIDDSKKVLDEFISGKNIFAIEKDGKVIGSVGIHKYDESFFTNFSDKLAVQLGFVLANAYQGQGIMTEALNLVLSYLFEVVKVDVVFGGHFRGNYKSKKIHKKLNYKYFSSHLVKTNMGTEEVTHEYFLTRKSYLEGKEEKNKDKSIEDATTENEDSRQLIRTENFKGGENISITNKFSSTLIFIRLGMVEYDTRIYVGGDIIRINNKAEVSLNIIRDTSMIVVESELR